jgi:simple sugar transport system permease protein
MAKKADKEHVLTAPVETVAIPKISSLTADPGAGFLARFRYNFQFIRGRGSFEITMVLLLLLVGYSSVGFLNPSGFAFLNPNNLSGVISQAIPVLAILGIAAGVLMVAGEFDLTIGFALTFNAIVFLRAVEFFGWGWGILAGILSGAMVSLINGVIVISTKIPSFIATLGMSFFWGGASIFINGTTPAMLNPGRDREILELMFTHNFGVFRSQLIWLVAVGIVMWFFLHRHRLGNHLFAVGGNAAAAKAISINPNKVKLMAFGIFGSLVGLASILIAVRTSSIQPGGNATQDFLLFAIAAAVVGGTALNGGRGSIIGMIAGAALIELIRNGLLLAKAPGFYITLFVGVTIVIAVIFNKVMEGKAS